MLTVESGYYLRAPLNEKACSSDVLNSNNAASPDSVASLALWKAFAISSGSSIFSDHPPRLLARSA